MQSEKTFESKQQKDKYEATLNYLAYENYSDKISIPIQVRERHLTPETEEAILQAVGTHLQIAIFSDRDDILLRCPLKSWQTTKAFQGTLGGSNGGHLSVGRFEESLAVVEVPDAGKGIHAKVQKLKIERP